jgi:hypothetical protein
MKQKYIDECKIIQQNCTYTAEAHHQMALVQKRYGLWLEIIPSVCAALTGALVAAGLASTDLLIITIISAVVSAVAGVLNPNRSYQEHLAAGKNFTTLKHDARFLHEATSYKMTDDAFCVCVENLHQRYNELLKTTPPTSPESFEKAQKVVKGRNHEPDKDKNGNIK